MANSKKDAVSIQAASAAFASAVAKGVLSSASSALITGNLGPLVLAGAAGKALEDLTATDVTLITVLIDASSSIADRGLEQAIRDGQNSLIDAFGGAKERDGRHWRCATSPPTWTRCTRSVEDATGLFTAKNYRAQGAARGSTTPA